MKRIFLYTFLFTINSFLFSQTTHNITVTDGSFNPSPLTINQGDTVVWNFVDGNHNVNGTLSAYSQNPEAFFCDFGLNSCSHTFNIAGTFGYRSDNSWEDSIFGYTMFGMIYVTSTTCEDSDSVWCYEIQDGGMPSNGMSLEQYCNIPTMAHTVGYFCPLSCGLCDDNSGGSDGGSCDIDNDNDGWCADVDWNDNNYCLTNNWFWAYEDGDEDGLPSGPPTDENDFGRVMSCKDAAPEGYIFYGENCELPTDLTGIDDYDTWNSENCSQPNSDGDFLWDSDDNNSLEICDDNIDNDGDGYVDCDDNNCDGTIGEINLACLSFTHTITAQNYSFNPSSLTIQVGDTVEWINQEGYHDVNGDVSVLTGDSYNNPQNFYISPASEGIIGTFTFDVPGIYNYDCSIGSHASNGMVASITVGLPGCTDINACNYDENADFDNGSCLALDCANVCGGDEEEDCFGECGGSAVIDSCGSCTLFPINSNGWQVVVNSEQNPIGCSWTGNSYEENIHWIQLENINSFEDCANECELNQDCTAFEYNKLTNEGCSLWLNGACDLSNESILPDGYMEITNDSWLHYEFTGQCSCVGDMVDCSGECGGTCTSCDCFGECNGSAVEDDCGVCNGDNSSCIDTCGVVNGDNFCWEEVDCGAWTKCPQGADFVCAYGGQGNCYRNSNDYGNGCDGTTGVADCDGSMICCPASWIGDDYYDCGNQQYTCDLSCYDNDGGDCDEGSVASSWYCSEDESYYATEVRCNNSCIVACTENLNSIAIGNNINNINFDHRKLEGELPSINSIRTECTFAAGPNTDCLGECNGDAVIDGCGYCGGPSDSNFGCVCEDDGSNCSVECIVEENCLGQCGVEIDDVYCSDNNSENLIASGGYHNLAIDSNKKVFAWGRNNDGEINVPIDLVDVIKVEAGEYHSLALKSDGTVVAWGENDNGQINVPFDLDSVIDISGGENHSIALKSDGTVVAWGHNNTNQLEVPLDLDDIVSISAGRDHNLALKSDGTVVTWGYDGYNLGDVPTDLNNVVAISAGAQFSLALKSDGTVVAWGEI